MSKKRLIDRIPEVRDRVTLPNDWIFLMEPFLVSLHVPHRLAATLAYSDVSVQSPAWSYLELKIDAILRIETKTEAIEHNLTILSGDSRLGAHALSNEPPILIVGEPGVGKTTWTLRFFTQEIVEQRFYFCYFDGRVIEDAFEDLSPRQFIRRSVNNSLFKAIYDASEKHNVETVIRSFVSEHGLPDNVEGMDGLSDALREGIKKLAKRGLTGWVVLDNLDRRPRQIQEDAIEIAKGLAEAGLRILVPVRPFTVRNIRSMDDMLCVTVSAPSLQDIMEKRIELAMEHEVGTRIIDLIKSGISIHNQWAGAIGHQRDLERLYEEVARTLASLPTLYRHLTAVHCGDLHEVLRDIRELMSSGYFALEIRRRLAGEDRDEREFLTAYMRGRYHHHRKSVHSGERIINLFETPSADRTNRFLQIRVLQFARKLSAQTGGVRVSELTERLGEFGYSPTTAIRATSVLVNSRLLLEIGIMRDWQLAELQIEDTDIVTISQAGYYYLDELICMPRYINAMAHVSHLEEDIVDSKMRLRNRTADDEFWNSSFLLEDVGNDLLREFTSEVQCLPR